jgi:hypothetical protein
LAGEVVNSEITKKEEIILGQDTLQFVNSLFPFIIVQIKKNFLAKIGKNILPNPVIKFMLIIGDENEQ